MKHFRSFGRKTTVVENIESQLICRCPPNSPVTAKPASPSNELEAFLCWFNLFQWHLSTLTWIAFKTAHLKSSKAGVLKRECVKCIFRPLHNEIKSILSTNESYSMIKTLSILTTLTYTTIHFYMKENVSAISPISQRTPLTLRRRVVGAALGFSVSSVDCFSNQIWPHCQ